MRRAPDGSLSTHADLTGLADPPWKDIVVDGRGNNYIGNIGFAFPAGEFAPGILALVTSDGSVRQVADGVAFPHGMVTSLEAAAGGNGGSCTMWRPQPVDRVPSVSGPRVRRAPAVPRD